MFRAETNHGSGAIKKLNTFFFTLNDAHMNLFSSKAKHVVDQASAVKRNRLLFIFCYLSKFYNCFGECLWLLNERKVATLGYHD